MNANFLGAPNRDDMHTLESLRRQLMPMIGLLEKLQQDMQFKLSRGETVDWPHIQDLTSRISRYLISINGYINGTYRHTAEEAGKDTAGKPILDEDRNVKMNYRDMAVAGHAEQLGNLHVFPQAPFPIANERFASMAASLLEKRLKPDEEKWVEEKIRKAAEFAYVPGEWGVEPKKPEVKEEEDSDDEENLKGWDPAVPLERVKGSLDEDAIMEVWKLAHMTVFDKEYGKMMDFEQGGDEERDQEDEIDEVGDEDEEMEDEDDVAGTPQAPAAAPVVMIQRAPPSVHKPVPGTLVMPLELVHRFMASGEIQTPAGQR
ncbi:hypothetical protein EK21DRAFT_87322 [Setomelanomma holmii]|uniref:Mediator complex subunit 8 n=1 Tax=Setomelanomma holmii TaxID=210430 RepID=A0A9P4HFR8_9PLEO|nr:hypothetical protein EK21DRAFT_87322 [Setomelanomma holmii]